MTMTTRALHCRKYVFSRARFVKEYNDEKGATKNMDLEFCTFEATYHYWQSWSQNSLQHLVAACSSDQRLLLGIAVNSNNNPR